MLRPPAAKFALTPDGEVCELMGKPRWEQWVRILSGRETGVRRYYDPKNLRPLVAQKAANEYPREMQT